MRQFVPMTDDLLYRAGTLPGPLVPYRCGLPCWHQLRVETEAGRDRAYDDGASEAEREDETVSA